MNQINSRVSSNVTNNFRYRRMKSESVLTSELQCKASLVRGWSTSESVLAQGEKLFDIHGIDHACDVINILITNNWRLSQSTAEQHRSVHTIDLVERQIDHISRCVHISVPNRATDCTSSHEVAFWMEPGWAGNGSRFDPTAHSFRLAKQCEQTCEVLYSLILITLACKPFVSRFVTHF